MAAVVETGDVLFDMNDYLGSDNLLKTHRFGTFKVIPESVQVVRCKLASQIVIRILDEAGVNNTYQNKMLVALNDGEMGQDIQAIYSYDSVRFGLMTLVPVEE